MDENTLGDYWKDVKPILKEINQKEREEHYDERIEYAIKKFKENNIPYKLCNASNGHFNLYKDNKVVMSFWSWTGKCYIPSINYSDNIGIKNCIKKYNKMFKEEKEMKEHLEDLKAGGRPMSKKEIRIKELEAQNELLEAELELNRRLTNEIIKEHKNTKIIDKIFVGIQIFLVIFLCICVYGVINQIKVDNMIVDNYDECVRVNDETYCRVVE